MLTAAEECDGLVAVMLTAAEECDGLVLRHSPQQSVNGFS
jgi:hypothetical protein